MKKALLPATTVVILLFVGAFFVKPSPVETPPQKKSILIPITAQRSDDGRVVTDPKLWDQNKGFFTAYVVVE